MPQVVLAGTDAWGFRDGPASSAQFYAPFGVALDRHGNLFVADRDNHRIRKLTPSGVVSTLAGSGTEGFRDGPGSKARFYCPHGVAMDGHGNILVADCLNHKIRSITPQGVVSTLAGTTMGFGDGPGSEAMFSLPMAVAVDERGNILVADHHNHRIRQISQGVVSTLAGSGTAGFRDGPGSEAFFNYPRGVAVDGHGNILVADYGNCRIRRVGPSGVVSTVAGSGQKEQKDGSCAEAGFSAPCGVAVGPGGTLFVSDENRIRRVSATGVSTLETQFVDARHLVLDGEGSLLVAEFGGNKIVKIPSASPALRPGNAQSEKKTEIEVLVVSFVPSLPSSQPEVSVVSSVPSLPSSQSGLVHAQNS